MTIQKIQTKKGIRIFQLVFIFKISSETISFTFQPFPQKETIICAFTPKNFSKLQFLLFSFPLKYQQLRRPISEGRTNESRAPAMASLTASVLSQDPSFALSETSTKTQKNPPIFRLKPLKTIMQRTSLKVSNTGAPSGSPGLYSARKFELTAENVDLVLEDIRPYLISDGGNVDVVSVEDGVISLKLQGRLFLFTCLEIYFHCFSFRLLMILCRGNLSIEKHISMIRKRRAMHQGFYFWVLAEVEIVFCSIQACCFLQDACLSIILINLSMNSQKKKEKKP